DRVCQTVFGCKDDDVSHLGPSTIRPFATLGNPGSHIQQRRAFSLAWITDPEGEFSFCDTARPDPVCLLWFYFAEPDQDGLRDAGRFFIRHRNEFGCRCD